MDISSPEGSYGPPGRFPGPATDTCGEEVEEEDEEMEEEEEEGFQAPGATWG